MSCIFRDKSIFLIFASGTLSGILISQFYNQLKKIFMTKKMMDLLKLKTEKEEKTVFLDDRDKSDQMHKNNQTNIQKQITKFDEAPLELRKRFDSLGYVIVSNALASTNTDLNEMIELMKKMELPMFDGCSSPSECSCKFRYKNSRLFVLRRYSATNILHYYSPNCDGVKSIVPTNADMLDNTQLHRFIQMFHNSFSSQLFDLVDFVRYITDPDMSQNYVVDITLIADPIKICDDLTIADKENSLTVDTNLNITNKCVSKWDQARYTEKNTDTTTPYDVVAQFVLSCKNVTPHKLMIGKLDSETNTVSVRDVWIESGSSDIGYIVDQRREMITKHSDYSYKTQDSHRNIVTVKIKYF